MAQTTAEPLARGSREPEEKTEVNYELKLCSFAVQFILMLERIKCV